VLTVGLDRARERRRVAGDEDRRRGRYGLVEEEKRRVFGRPRLHGSVRGVPAERLQGSVRPVARRRLGNQASGASYRRRLSGQKSTARGLISGLGQRRRRGWDAQGCGVGLRRAGPRISACAPAGKGSPGLWPGISARGRGCCAAAGVELAGGTHWSAGGARGAGEVRGDAGRASRGEAGRAREELGCGERAEAGRGWQAGSRAGPSGEVA
jgi:hypothetical protein